MTNLGVDVHGRGLELRRAFDGFPSPNFFIVGAPKCGTTAMAASLAEHPDVYMSSPKEPHAFGSDLASLRRRMPPEEYVGLFRDVGSESRVGEASVWYLRSRTAAQEIRDFDPSARIVVMLRNPVDVLYSLHGQALQAGLEHIRDFASALDAEPARRRGERMGGGVRHPGVLLYSEAVDFTRQIERFLRVFGRPQVHVIVMDDVVSQPTTVMERIQRFLEIDVIGDLRLLRRNEHSAVRSVRVQRLFRESGFLRFASRALLTEKTRIRVGRRTIRYVDRINTVRQARSPLPSALRAELTERFRPEVERLGLLLDSRPVLVDEGGERWGMKRVAERGTDAPSSS